MTYVISVRDCPACILNCAHSKSAHCAITCNEHSCGHSVLLHDCMLYISPCKLLMCLETAPRVLHDSASFYMHSSILPVTYKPSLFYIYQVMRDHFNSQLRSVVPLTVTIIVTIQMFQAHRWGGGVWGMQANPLLTG